MMVDNSSGNWIRLNVGGKVFQTTKQTLRMYPGSFLALLCDVEGIQPSEKDESGAYLIDRDPEHFRLILNFLRNGSLDTDGSLPYDGLRKEAEFYGLTELAALIGEARKEEIKPEAAECITMFYSEGVGLVDFYSGDNDLDEAHVLIAELMELQPWCSRRIHRASDGTLSLSLSPREFQRCCTQVAAILCTEGFKLHGMSDSNLNHKWVFVKRG